MRVRYDFPVRSEIKVTADQWPNLELEHDETSLTVEKPIYKGNLFFSEHFLPLISSRTSINREAFRQAGLFTDLSMSTVALEIERARGSTEPTEFFEHFHKPAMDTLRDLLSWVRVLTRQYWIGYADRSFMSWHGMATMLTPNEAKDLGQHGIGWNFEYGRPLDLETWLEIGKKLVKRDRPAVSQLFFCDALLDILQDNVSQAIVVLGAACDLEMYRLVQDLVAEKDRQFQRVFTKYVRYSFKESFKLINELADERVSDIDPVIMKWVCILYDMRGKAVHRGQSYYEEDGKQIVVTRVEMPRFVEAAESFFSWSEAQRSKILGTG